MCGSIQLTLRKAFPPIPVGSKIKSIDLIFDEGTDTANNNTQGVGLSVLDNININGVLLTSKHPKDQLQDKDDDDDNQGPPQ